MTSQRYLGLCFAAVFSGVPVPGALAGTLSPLNKSDIAKFGTLFKTSKGADKLASCEGYYQSGRETPKVSLKMLYSPGAQSIRFSLDIHGISGRISPLSFSASTNLTQINAGGLKKKVTDAVDVGALCGTGSSYGLSTGCPVECENWDYNAAGSTPIFEAGYCKSTGVVCSPGGNYFNGGCKYFTQHQDPDFKADQEYTVVADVAPMMRQRNFSAVVEMPLGINGENPRKRVARLRCK